MHYTYLETPIGKLLLAGNEQALSLVGFPEGKGKVAPQRDWLASSSMFDSAKQQLMEYFAGSRQDFSLSLSPTGTEFQLAVLRALQEIPFGETCSYLDIAQAVQRPKAVRAVGAANGRNPLPIVIPCHRVIGSNGSLTGFGGGLETKTWLLNHESRVVGGQGDLF